MNGKTMDERVTDLEKLAESLAPLPVRMEAVEGPLVEETPLGTVESQIVQLRTEVHAGSSTVRREMAAFRTAVRADLAAYGMELTGHILEARREMRVLHEEVIRRIALIGERRAPEA